MAKVKKRKPSYVNGSRSRVSPLKPSLRGAQNWTAAKVRAASYSKKSFLQFCGGVFALFLLLVFFALWLGGFWPAFLQNGKVFKQNRLMDMGFVVSRVDVMGEGRLNEQDVLKAVNVRPGDYFFGVDLETAQRRTESLPWVESAVVRRLWPNRIVVQLVENQPYAVWQNAGELNLIKSTGDVIAPVSAKASFPSDLLHVVGKGAGENAQILDTQIREWPGLRAKTVSAIYVSELRWDIMIEGGVKVKLPQRNIDQALARLAKLQRATQILDRQVSEIDLRLPNRITILPNDAKQA